MPREVGPDIETLRAQTLDNIDRIAGEIRLRFISPGALVEEEYRQAENAVEQWRAAGSPAGDVPAEIRAGAIYSDMTDEQAAQEIETTAQIYNLAIQRSRTIRLTYKGVARFIITSADIRGAEIDAQIEADKITLAAITAEVTGQ